MIVTHQYSLNNAYFSYTLHFNQTNCDYSMKKKMTQAEPNTRESVVKKLFQQIFRNERYRFRLGNFYKTNNCLEQI